MKRARNKGEEQVIVVEGHEQHVLGLKPVIHPAEPNEARDRQVCTNLEYKGESDA